MLLSLLPGLSAASAVRSLELYEGTYKTSFSHLSEGQQIANQIVLKISAVLSMGGSSYIMYNLLGPRREKELYKSMFSRLLFGLCVSDFCASLALFMGSWAIPADSFHSPDLVWNVGTQATCDVQGFSLQVFYFSSIFYTACLSINFLLCVKYQWKEKELRAKVEPYMHLISWIIPIVLATVCQVSKMYNPTAFFCYVVTYPIGCDHYEDMECIRGDNTWMWRSIAQIVPFGVCFGTICYCMVMIYRSVRKQERAMEQYRYSMVMISRTVRKQERAMEQYSNAWVRRRARDSRLAMNKAAQYIGVFVAVWTPVLLVALCEDLGQKIPFAIWIIDAFMIPIVGLFNGIVYSRMIDPIDTFSRSVTSFKSFATNSQVQSNSSISRLITSLKSSATKSQVPEEQEKPSNEESKQEEVASSDFFSGDTHPISEAFMDIDMSGISRVDLPPPVEEDAKGGIRTVSDAEEEDPEQDKADHTCLPEEGSPQNSVETAPED